MLDELLARLRGQVQVRVESPYPERVLNLCAARRLPLREVRWLAPDAFACTLTRQDYRVLRLLGRKLDCTVTVEKRRGAPYFLGRLRRRRVLLACLIAWALWMLAGSFFIWDVTVDGAVTVPEEKILRALEKNGVGFGTFGMSIDADGLRNRVLLEVPELCWITVNVSGCRACVQVRERTPPPALVDRTAPANVVARRDGLVLRVRPYQGVKCVLAGTTVEAGQILISGVEDSGTYGARVLAGRGTVEARTWYHLTARMPLTVEEKAYTGVTRTGFAVVFGNRRIKLLGNSSDSGARYDKISTRTKLSLLGLSLPVAVERETCRFYELQPRQRTAQEAEAAGKELLTEYLAQLMGQEGSVSSTLCTSRQNGDALEVTLAAECVEQIGVQVPIIQTEEKTGGAA